MADRGCQGRCCAGGVRPGIRVMQMPPLHCYPGLMSGMTPISPEVIGPDAQRQCMQGIFAAFSDLALEEQMIIADGGMVAIRLLISGRRTGEFLGIAASDRQVAFQAVDVFRVEGAALAEQWAILDVLGLHRQLGALPAG